MDAAVRGGPRCPAATSAQAVRPGQVGDPHRRRLRSREGQRRPLVPGVTGARGGRAGRGRARLRGGGSRARRLPAQDVPPQDGPGPHQRRGPDGAVRPAGRQDQGVRAQQRPRHVHGGPEGPLRRHGARRAQGPDRVDGRGGADLLAGGRRGGVRARLRGDGQDRVGRRRDDRRQDSRRRQARGRRRRARHQA